MILLACQVKYVVGPWRSSRLLYFPTLYLDTRLEIRSPYSFCDKFQHPEVVLHENFATCRGR